MIGGIEIVDDVVDERLVQMFQVCVDLPPGDVRAVAGREIGSVRTAQQFLCVLSMSSQKKASS